MDRIEPRIHDEIKDYKEKFYNFTLRQWLFGILLIITIVPLYLFLTPKIGSNLTGWIVIIAAIPIIFGAISSLPSSVRVGGTSLLIVVGVALETYKQLDSELITRSHTRGRRR